MELRHVHAIRLARQMIGARTAGLSVAILLLLRLAMAALLPLSADEAYYWLWSRHLAAGYYDHPPAIAFVIRVGTWLLGDTELGVRLGGVLLSVLASWFIWQTARLVLKDEARAALAALLFNLTLMIGVETLAATPDTLSVTATAGLMFFLVKARESGDGRWWLGVGLLGGLGLLSKYSGFFIGLGALVWLLAGDRASLKTIWPWLGALLVCLIFLPNLWWQMGHHWMTFAFQFGRVTDGHLTGRYLLEFAGSQLGLATPFILVLMILGLWRARQPNDPRFPLLCLTLPALIYFLIHALHDRVQGNWPSFLYPMLAVLAADAFRHDWRNLSSRLAVPVAALVLFAAYLQAASGFLPIRADPLARLLGVGMRDTVKEIVALKSASGARVIAVSDYEMTSWLHFYAPGLPLVAVDQPDRYLDSPALAPLPEPLLYVADREPDAAFLGDFSDVGRLRDVTRARHGRIIARYAAWRLAAPKQAIQGKLP